MKQCTKNGLIYFFSAVQMSLFDGNVLITQYIHIITATSDLLAFESEDIRAELDSKDANTQCWCKTTDQAVSPE